MTDKVRPAPPATNIQDVAAMLSFYAEAGVTFLVQETPASQYLRNEGEKEKVTVSQGISDIPLSSVPSVPSAPLNTGHVATRTSVPDSNTPLRNTPVFQARENARELAAQARTLSELRNYLDAFTSCSLRKTATQTVFADGEPESRIMLIGEAPGADEDRQGLPFVGVSGKLLDAMMNSIGLDRTKFYITNVVPWRPPGNRKPTPEEVALCLPFLERHIQLAGPKVILALGGLSAQQLLGKTDGITRLRGQWGRTCLAEGAGNIPVLPTFHPAYLLRTPGQKRLAWVDLLAFHQKISDPSEA